MGSCPPKNLAVGHNSPWASVCSSPKWIQQCIEKWWKAGFSSTASHTRQRGHPRAGRQGKAFLHSGGLNGLCLWILEDSGDPAYPIVSQTPWGVANTAGRPQVGDTRGLVTLSLGATLEEKLSYTLTWRGLGSHTQALTLVPMRAHTRWSHTGRLEHPLCRTAHKLIQVYLKTDSSTQ